MHHILIRSVLSVDLAFGLHWLPLISGRASTAARRIARRHNATHIVLDGDAPASFGYGFLRARATGGPRTAHSAAQNMARLHPSGSVAAIVPVEPEGHWLVAVHEGAVIARTDVVYRLPGQAEQAMHELRRAYPRLTVLHPEGDGLTLEALAAASDAGTALKNTGHRRRRWLLGMLVLAATVLAWVALKNPADSAVARPGSFGLDEHEILLRWSKAFALAEQGIAIHGVAATHAVLRHLYQVPAAIAGWTLLRVNCSASASSWRCNADYDRKRHGADNQGLLAAAPQDWQLEFPTIDRAGASWSFRTEITPMGRGHIDTAADIRRHVQSAWQSIRPAFSRVVLGPARPVEVPPPLDDAGRPLPRPAGLHGYAKRTVDFEGPLRSISLLLPHTRSIAWRSITLVLGDTPHPTLVSSRLRATFQGDLYELYEANDSTNAPLADQARVPAMDEDGGAAGHGSGLHGPAPGE